MNVCLAIVIGLISVWKAQATKALLKLFNYPKAVGNRASLAIAKHSLQDSYHHYGFVVNSLACLGRYAAS